MEEVIDFHVHFFPDAVAPKAIKSLSEAGDIKSFGDGTYGSLLQYMKEDSVSYSVNQPVATKAEQVISINRQMIELNQSSSSVICFGTMHPAFNQTGNVREELEYISRHGIRGIKLHPEYQSFYPDDPSMTSIYEACRDFNLMITFHSGKDIAYEEVHGTPARLAQVAKVKSLNIVLAHMGGYQMWDDVERYIVGLPSVYLDTAYSLEMEDWQMKEIILGHGSDNVLYASDFPWQRQSDIIQKIKKLGLGAILEIDIFSKNARRLLKLL